MTKKFNHYLGKAGHLAIMSEFLMRGWNVAIPEVDIGDDIFVVQDDNGTLRRVQVKTGTSKAQKKGFSAQFIVSERNLKKNPENLIKVHYIFLARHNEGWSKPVIIRQDYLLDHYETHKVGSLHKGNITFYFSFSEDKIMCGGQDFTKYVCDYDDFPLIEH